MKFDRAIVRKMHKKNQQTFDILIQAWNLLHVGEKDYRPIPDLVALGHGMVEFQLPSQFKKSERLFTRAYNNALTSTPPKPSPKRKASKAKSD